MEGRPDWVTPALGVAWDLFDALDASGVVTDDERHDLEQLHEEGLAIEDYLLVADQRGVTFPADLLQRVTALIDERPTGVFSPNAGFDDMRKIINRMMSTTA